MESAIAYSVIPTTEQYLDHDYKEISIKVLYNRDLDKAKMLDFSLSNINEQWTIIIQYYLVFNTQ